MTILDAFVYPSFVSYLHRRTTDTRVGVIVVPLVVVGPVSRRVGRVVDIGDVGWVKVSRRFVTRAQLPLFLPPLFFFFVFSFTSVLFSVKYLPEYVGFRKELT